MEADDVARALFEATFTGADEHTYGLTPEPAHEDTAFFLVHDDGAKFLVTVAKVSE